MSEQATPIFRMSQKSLLNTLRQLYGKWYIVTALSIMTVLILLSIITSDLRVVILALMFLFLITPMIIALLYINYALSPDISFNVLPHSIEREEGVIRITIYEKREGKKKENREDDEEDNSAGDNDAGDHDSGDEDNEESDSPIHTLSFKSADLSSYIVFSNYIIVPFGNKRGFIYLPLSIFKSGEEMLEYVKSLNGKTENT